EGPGDRRRDQQAPCGRQRNRRDDRSQRRGGERRAAPVLRPHRGGRGGGIRRAGATADTGTSCPAAPNRPGRAAGMNGSPPRLYRAAMWLYPPSFRREFAADLEQAFRDLRRDHGALSACRRTSVDLALSIPTEHLEAVMARTAAPATKLASAAVLAAALVGTFIFGRPAVWFPAVIISAVAALAYRHSRTPYREAVRTSGRLWLWFLGAGVGLFAVLIG